MGTLLKIIIFAVIIHYLFKLVFRFVLPLFISNRVKNSQKKKEKAHRDFMERQKAEEGKVTIEYNGSNSKKKKQKNMDEKGEYVDYEEIK